MKINKFRGSIFLIPLIAFIQMAMAQQPTSDAVEPTQQQIDQLLRGNSNIGVWADRPFIQFFEKNGATYYQEEGSRTTAGTWRINQDGEYCSMWPPFPRETCYELLVDGNTIYWKWENSYYLSKVVQGNIFDQQ